MKLKVGLQGVGASAATLVKVPLVAANNALFIRLMLGAHGVENTLTKCAPGTSEREKFSLTQRRWLASCLGN
jgi:hypothetical protein